MIREFAELSLCLFGFSAAFAVFGLGLLIYRDLFKKD